MLKISQFQLDTFESVVGDDFVDDLSEAVVENYPETTDRLTSSDIREFVVSGLERARGFGFTDKRSLGAFVCIMFGVAPNFYRHPQIDALLRNPAMPMEQRMEALPDAVPDAVWEEVVNNYDTSAW